jgi:hypothetical protein
MRKVLIFLAVVCLSACSDPEKERLRQTTKPTYDENTGKLKELTFDYNKNGKIDTWTRMDGARPVLTSMDRDEDGKLDRWEYYDSDAKLIKVGFSRKNEGKPDAWAFEGPDKKVERIEISSTYDDRKIDRWEHYDAAGLVRSEDDTNADGRPDQWHTYKAGAIHTATFDDDKDGRADRRWTYEGSALVLIETEPDAAGNFTKHLRPKQ